MLRACSFTRRSRLKTDAEPRWGSSVASVVITFRTDDNRQLQRLPTAEGLPCLPVRGDVVRLSVGLVR